MNILLADDEALARKRLRHLLEQCSGITRLHEAVSAEQVLERLRQSASDPVDILLLDIHMPGMNGVGLARQLRDSDHAPVVVFVTADPDFAVQAFDLAAADYLTKPVRLERLQQALQRAALLRGVAQRPSARAPTGQHFIPVHQHGGTERVALDSVLFCKAEQKYVSIHTPHKAYLYDGSLNELEAAHPQLFLRIHRNALATRQALRALHRTVDGNDTWLLSLHGTEECLSVSRRQLPAVRAAIQERTP
ncbi:two component transcriptional regulator, LytTR family [Lampropedia hyalina DSM 16112]|jgi:two-component system response regulator AlgR|uniref:Two component transcriptional regulator, LytTR family n=1 Tax=Lampropedia hyalina DSM 16112 TaxID=1122156 RepID=A0A1M4V4W4_9BURK|nr:LytTR family DNA-binding domain-containing protein [Lampropedia hyalina]SHE63985.1 two component transcriptional regulator, LytTR family [Lampropedia hyalina DSM 16112]